MKKIIVCPHCNKETLMYEYPTMEQNRIIYDEIAGKPDYEYDDTYPQEPGEEEKDCVFCAKCGFEEYIIFELFFKKYPKSIVEVKDD